MIQGLHLPERSPLSPSFLDPTLVPQTLDAVLYMYQKNKALINQWNWENERYFATWFVKFNCWPSLGASTFPFMPPNEGMRSGQFASFGYAPRPASHMPTGQGPMSQAREPTRKPTPGPNPGQMRGSMTEPEQFLLDPQATRGQTASPQPKKRQGPASSRSSLREVQNVQSSPPKNHNKRSSLDMAFCFPEGHKSSKETVKAAHTTHMKPYAQMNVQAVRPTNVLTDSVVQRVFMENDFLESRIGADHDANTLKNEVEAKFKLQDEIAAANLPAPTISDEALRAAGITPKLKTKHTNHASGPAVSSSKPKSRPRKAPFPAEGIRVSESLRNSLLAAGAKELAQRPLAPVAQGTHAAMSGVSNSQEGCVTSAPKPRKTPLDLKIESEVGSTDDIGMARFSEASLRSGIAKTTQDRIAKTKKGLKVRKASRKKNFTSETSNSSLDGPEDPKDGEEDERSNSRGKAASINEASVISNRYLTPDRNPATPRKTSVVSVKRRSSITLSGSAEKRTCRSVELNDKIYGEELAPKGLH